MNSLIVLALLLAADPAPAEKNATPEQRLVDRRHALNLEQARKWEIFTDQTHREKAELIERPVYLWTNPVPRFGAQYGSVFVWLHAGRPLAVGSFFVHPIDPTRGKLIHEFHSLPPTIISAVCSDEQANVWKPKAALEMKPVPGAPPPEATAPRRLIQIRSLAREFSGHTIDWRKERWQLRLLAQPLYRYEKPEGEIIDGAILALVTDAGTDPEVLLLLEAHKDGWHYALLRFCDASVWVNHKDKEIWTAVRDSENAQLNSPDYTYQVFQKQIIPLDAEAAGEPQP